MDALVFDTEYLNRTVNKSDRGPSERYIGVIWHETANGSGNAKSTLNWNLSKSVGTSYDFLIGRDGQIYKYLSYDKYTSWDSGVADWTIDGTVYRDWALNSVTLGIELDGPADGTPITAYQLDSAARLALFLHETEGIPLDRGHHLTHAEIARNRTTNKRFDPRGTTPGAILEKVQELQANEAEPGYDAFWGDAAVFHPTWRIPGAWKRHYQTLGPALAVPFDTAGGTTQEFQNGFVRFSEETGAVAYLPESET